MIHTLLYNLAATAVAKIDKEKAAKGVAAIATAVAKGQGSPVLRQAASALAHSLQGGPGPAPQQPAPKGPLVEWERVVAVMRSVQADPPAATVGRSAPATAHQQPRPPRTVQRGTMSGAYDAINLGGFTFGLMRSQQNTQLVVGQIGAPGNVGGLFSLTGVRSSTWMRLQDRGSRQLPVWVSVQGEDVELMVGDGPTDAVVLRAVDGTAGAS
jgi:hypothetical protein